MLTSDLLVTKTYKGRIEPVYAPLDPENLEIAASVIAAFQEHVGRTYGELALELDGLEEINYRLIRGMAQILERRCIIDKDSAIDPAAARRAVFEESRGFITSAEERKGVLDRVACKLSIESNDLEKALFADQEENLVIKEFQNITPENLLREYNLSLTQTLLFKAAGMEILADNKYQEVFRKIKQLGLMYSIIDDKMYLDGPISLFRLTEKYGVALAKLLPTIIASERWSLKASIIRRTSQGKRVYDFSLDHTRRSIFIKEPEDSRREHVSFDSAIEKEFYQCSFKGWTVRREPAVLKSGRYAFIPDFSLERNGTRIYVEIIGFWTPDYLRNKIQKINQLKENDSILLLIDRKLGCSGSEFKTDNLIFYDRKIPQLEIIKVLRKYEEKQLADEITKLKSIEISLNGAANESVISIDEVAGRYGVSAEALKEVTKGQSQIKADYLLMGDQLVSRQILETIQGELKGVNKHDEALEILKRHGIKAHGQALASLGYKVKWSGLNPEDAEIIRQSSHME